MNCTVFGAVTVLLTVSAAAQTREAAVAAARAGRTEEGAKLLRSLIAAGDTSPATAFDLAVVLTWDKRSREATDVFETTQPADTPEYVLLAMTRAYWDQKRHADAERLARRGRQQFAEQKEWVRLIALIAGEAAERSGDLFTALREYGEARRELPDDATLNAAAAGVLARLGAPYAAASAMGRPDAGLEAHKAGLMVRWGAEIRAPDPGRRHEETDAALARLDALLEDAASATPVDAGLITRLRRDRVVALRDRNRWSDAVRQAEQLRAGGDRLPNYVRQAEADSLLALRRPAEARRAYSEVIEAEPRNGNALVGRFYSEIETEDFRAAFDTIDRLAQSSSALGYQVAAGQVRNYAEMNAEAWRRLYPLSRQAPAAAYLRTALGEVAAARGWRRRSAEEVEISASLAPGDIGARVALAGSALRTGHYAEARQQTQTLKASYPGEPAVQRLGDEIRRFDAFELRTNTLTYRESNSSDDSPGDGFETTTRIYSPPLGERLRLVGGFDYASAKPVEGLAQRYRSGGGLEWRLPWFTVEATGWSNTGTIDRGGAQLTLNWRPADRWNLGADAQLFSTAIPLRALLYGITGSSAGFSAGYDWNESTGWAVNSQLVNFSDGNRRRAGGFRFAQRVCDRPHLKMTIRPDAYASANSKPGAPYFNPSKDFSGSAVLETDHILWRRYERSFRQRLSAGGGAYWQQGYGTRELAVATYEQAFQFGPSAEAHYGATIARRVYDGDAVNSITISVGLSARF